MARIGFADESGTTSNIPCYAIGVFAIDTDGHDYLNERFFHLKQQHGVDGEVKWTRVRKGHGLINFILDWTDYIFRTETATFDAIVVHKDLFRNWQTGEEEAFYQTYTYLLRHLARRTNEPAEILIDNRSDRYTKRHEMVETIGNHMLSQLHSRGRLESVRKVNSKDVPGVQISDVLTGAIASAHLKHLRPDAQVHDGKLLAISRISQMLNWDNLCYDTFPHNKFNIWHFPIEYRSVPRSRTPDWRGVIPYVSKEDF